MTFDVELESSSAAPARARSALEQLASRLSSARMRDVRLLVSELVTNAVRHADADADGDGEGVRLVVAINGGTLRVEVHDPGHGFAVREAPTDPLRASGWGLVLVAELSDRWGVDHTPRTRVWFEIDD
jgi:anti-sigma regulatory factor (Ser/Thr protein kinase)